MAINDSEQQIVFAAKNGNKICFEKLYKKYYQKIYALAFTTTKNAADAEDVLQITFIKAWNNISKLENVSAFNTWLQRIALNECNLLMNKRKPSLSIDADEDDSYITNELESDLMLPEVYAEQEDLSARLRKIIFQLSDVQRQTIILFYFDNLTIPEIAEIMNCNENTVKSRLYLARKAIRIEIEEQERKTGTKFFGVVGIPMLPFSNIFISQVEKLSISEAAAEKIYLNIDAVINKASSSIAASTVDASIKAVGTNAVKSGMPLALKVLIGILGTSVAVGGVAGIIAAVSMNNSKDVIPESTTSVVNEVAETTEQPTTEAPTTSDYSNAFRAYRQLLEKDEALIKNYNWQLGAGNESKPIVFCDIAGDDTPEMIYVKAIHMMSENQGATSLNIVTYQDGETVTLYDSGDVLSWDQNEAGAGQSSFLFQVNEDNKLYAFVKGADQYTTETIYQFDDNGNSLTCNEFTGSREDLLGNISDILMISEELPESVDVYTNAHKNEAMTYDEALAFLGITSNKTDNNRSTEPINDESKTMAYEAYLDKINEYKGKDDPLYDYSKYYLYDVDKDGIPELFVGFGTGLTQGYDMYTYKSGDSYATNVKQIMAGDGGPAVDSQGNLCFVGGRSGYYFKSIVELDGYEYNSYSDEYSDGEIDALEGFDLNNLNLLKDELLN